MKLWDTLKAWWRNQRIEVCRDTPDTDICRIRVFDGTTEPTLHFELGTFATARTQTFRVTRNNTFALACVCWRMQYRKVFWDVSLDVLVPLDNGEQEATHLVIPDGLAPKFYRDIIRLAKEFGWKGECPQPHPGAYR
jgi:hypothetical protein